MSLFAWQFLVILPWRQVPPRAAVHRVWNPGQAGSLFLLLSASLMLCRHSRGATQASWDWVSVLCVQWGLYFPSADFSSQWEKYHLAQRVKQQTNKTQHTHLKMCWQLPLHSLSLASASVPSSPTCFDFVYIGSKKTTTLSVGTERTHFKG